MRMQSIHSGSLGYLIAQQKPCKPYRPPVLHPSNELSERQIEVLVLIGSALTDAEIGKRLGISTETVKRHGMDIRDKIGVDNRVAMALYAVRNGLVEA